MGEWQQIEIAGKWADVFAPTSPFRFAVLHLHGVGGETLTDNIAYTEVLNELSLACVCPHGQQSWWSDRICAEFDRERTAERYLLNEVIPWMESRWSLLPRSIGISGISMGGQGALRLAFKHPARFPVVAAVSSAIDYHEWFGQGTTIDEMYTSREQCRQDSATLHIHPSKQPSHIYFVIDPADEMWFRGNDRLHEKLRALGVPHQVDFETAAGGHSWAYFDRMARPTLRFIRDSLESIQLRLM